MVKSIIAMFIVSLVVLVSSAPTGKELRNRRNSANPIDYLTEFGYLSRSNQETGQLRSNDEIDRAVKNLQKMAGLPQTGDVDDPELAKIMTQPRCGIGDSRVGKDPNAPSSFHISDLKWEKKDITFKIEGYSVDYGKEFQRSDIHRAFAIWKNVSDLNFIEVHPDDKADILIDFGRYDHRDGYPFDGRGGTLAHAFPPGQGRGGDAHFDEDELWNNIGKDGTTDLFIVAAHEFGHSLGIFHSDRREALMYPWYQGYKPHLELSYDDIAAIQTLYGPPKRGRDSGGKPPIIATSLPSTTTRRPTPSPRPKPTQTPGTDEPPNPCNTDIDAVSLVRGEVFAFKGKWFWRFNRQGELMEEKPIKTSYFWNVLPKNLERIDAVTYIPNKDINLFFSGDKYWILRGRSLFGGTPSQGYPLTRLGLPAEIKEIDAVLTWGLNDRTYLFSEYVYWRLDNTTNDTKVEKGYPKTFDIWQGIPVPIDAAFKDIDGSTYFFRGTQIFRFEDKNMMVDPRYPKDIGTKWLNCKYKFQEYRGSASLPRTSLASLGGFVSILLIQLLRI